MLDALITSKTRVRLLVKFFINPAMQSYLRELAEEFGESTNAVRLELNRLTEAGILESENQGNLVMYKAKTSHPLFPDIKNIVNKITGIDGLVANVVARLGNIERAFLIGDYAAGKDSGIIDLLIQGEVDKIYLNNLVDKAEQMVQRRIRYLIMGENELTNYLNNYKGRLVVLWTNGQKV
jgi:DNA-binding transcriptional ArsR family regulator